MWKKKGAESKEGEGEEELLKKSKKVIESTKMKERTDRGNDEKADEGGIGGNKRRMK